MRAPTICLWPGTLNVDFGELGTQIFILKCCDCASAIKLTSNSTATALLRKRAPLPNIKRDPGPLLPVSAQPYIADSCTRRLGHTDHARGACYSTIRGA